MLLEGLPQMLLRKLKKSFEKLRVISKEHKIIPLENF